MKTKYYKYLHASATGISSFWIVVAAIYQVGQVCISCGVCMGRYYCGICKLFDDDVSYIFFYAKIVYYLCYLIILSMLFCRLLRNSITAMVVVSAGMIIYHLFLLAKKFWKCFPPRLLELVSSIWAFASLDCTFFSFFWVFLMHVYICFHCNRIGGQENFFHCNKCRKWCLPFPVWFCPLCAFFDNFVKIFILMQSRMLLFNSFEEQPSLCWRSNASGLPCLLWGMHLSRYLLICILGDNGLMAHSRVYSNGKIVNSAVSIWVKKCCNCYALRAYHSQKLLEGDARTLPVSKSAVFFPL